ncbi:TPA: small toxic inner membrane protein TimP [Klebsiella aerogenes]
MKRYICIVLIVSGAIFSHGKDSWSISGNSFRVTINVLGK